MAPELWMCLLLCRADIVESIHFPRLLAMLAVGMDPGSSPLCPQLWLLLVLRRFHLRLDP